MGYNYSQESVRGRGTRLRANKSLRYPDLVILEPATLVSEVVALVRDQSAEGRRQPWGYQEGEGRRRG